MSNTVVVTIPGMISSADLDPLRQCSEIEYIEREKVTEAELASLCEGRDYLMINYDVIKEISPSFYADARVKSLSGISADITGMDWAAPEAAAAEGVTLYNIPHYSSRSVAESIVSEVLLHSRQRHLAYMDVAKGKEPEARQGINLNGRTAGIVGMGSIGTQTAALLRALGMHVLGWNRSERQVDDVEMVSLEHLFDSSDVICVCLKTVREGVNANVNIVSAELLSRCKEAIVVNLANGALVDHEAMVDAIEAGNVIGYTVEKSQAPDTPDLSLIDRVHLPPSNAWASEESLATLRETWVGNVIAAIEGRPQNALAL